MVICRYFQQGNCRFGSKCHYDHLDIKQIVKADIDAAIAGKQWPFSCYGPFKDKPCVPNFIEDQSFEEVRFLCYEARRQNFLEQFHQQFTKEVIEATNKKKALIHSTAKIDTIIKLYDAPEPNKTQTISGHNPFGLNASNNVNNCGSTANIFGKTNVTSDNIFGNNTNAVFKNNNTTNANSIFGTGTTTSANSIFGGGVSTAMSNPNSIFSGNVTKQSSNIFGQMQLKHQISVFGQQTQPSIFNQQQNMLGGVNSSNNPFNQANTNSASCGNMFAQNQQPQQTQINNSGFGLFNQAAPLPTTQFFGQQQQQQPHFLNQQNSVFSQQQNSQVGATMFAQNNGNVFAQSVPSTATVTNSVFVPAQQQQQNQINSFKQNGIPQPNQLGGMQQSNVDLSVYSRIEDLTAEEIEAFKANEFVPGRLPFSPPSYEFVNRNEINSNKLV